MIKTEIMEREREEGKERGREGGRENLVSGSFDLLFMFALSSLDLVNLM